MRSGSRSRIAQQRRDSPRSAAAPEEPSAEEVTAREAAAEAAAAALLQARMQCGGVSLAGRFPSPWLYRSRARGWGGGFG